MGPISSMKKLPKIIASELRTRDSYSLVSWAGENVPIVFESPLLKDRNFRRVVLDVVSAAHTSTQEDFSYTPGYFNILNLKPYAQDERRTFIGSFLRQLVSADRYGYFFREYGQTAHSLA